MKLIRKLEDFPSHLRGGALSIGNFDGVHRGHAHLIERLKAQAVAFGGPAIVFTFDPHPVRLLNQIKAPPPLTWTDRKAELLGMLGVDIVLAYPTNRELLELSHQEFFEQIVEKKLGAQAMVEGPNFFFGKNRTGNTDALRELCDARSIALEIVAPIVVDNEFISSSRVRELLAAGEVELATHMLTQPYRLRGMVTHGAGRGSELGFPTANLSAVDTLVPGIGVYAGKAHVDHTCRWAAIHIGPSPTFGDKSKIEVHILDFSSSIYGRTVEIEFVREIRTSKKFESAAALQVQLHNDINQIRQIAGELSKKVDS